MRARLLPLDIRRLGARLRWLRVRGEGAAETAGVLCCPVAVHLGCACPVD